ncbi:MAG: 50S ribosomal protein L11 methyltransferase [Campylobacteraceae bacterium]|jgi:ribosomal protein L11 methyltransferase|nr:50S ribosomal protein L11 methyltransferase [Campylobacteraceae bacterium]
MCEKYFELCVYPSAKPALFSDFLLEFTDAVEESGGRLIVRSCEPLDIVEFGVKEYAKKLGIETKTTISQKTNEDWVKKYQESVQPVEVGIFYIRPSWKEPKKGFTDIVINPALAFGSGHHESTYGCLLMLQRYTDIGSRMLDVGTGSGILAIAASKLGAIADVCDTDAQALNAAEENFSKNGVKYKNAWIGSANEAKGYANGIKYNIITANIIADILLAIKNDLINALNEEGILILSGILDKYVGQIREHYAALSLIDEFRENEWHTLVYKR